MRAAADWPPCNPRHSWLAAVLPASARRFRVDDADLAATLRHAGASMADEAPDVEVGPAESLRGDARWAIVSLDAGDPERRSEEPSQLARAGTRLRDSLLVRLAARRAQRSVRRRGYPSAAVLLWELGGNVRLPGLPPPRARREPSHRLPLGAVVVGARDTPYKTVFAAAVAAAEEQTGVLVRPSAPLVRESGLVALGPETVLRVAVGPTGRHIDAQRSALEALAEARAEPQLAERVPWLLGSGNTGLALWSLERHLPGRPLEGPLEGAILDDCLEFLAVLFAAAPAAEPRASVESDAEVVSAALEADDGRALVALGRRLDHELRDLPRGFAHGDFSPENLLVERDRLAGVADWEQAATGRLPLFDLLHLLLHEHWRRAGGHLGQAFARFLFPWARGGGDGVSRAHARRLGMLHDGRVLEALSVAYTLSHYAYQLTTYTDRLKRPAWLRRNVLLALEPVLSEPSRTGPRVPIA